MRIPGRRSKIVCTLGPAVAHFEGIKKLIEEGMDIARLNFSHGTHKEHKNLVSLVRRASSELNIPVGILADLQGPKIRTGNVTGEILLKKGESVYFTPHTQEDADGSKDRPIQISYNNLCKDLKIGDSILIDDGLNKLSVVDVDPEKGILESVVDFGYSIKSRKGVNMPSAKLSASGITEKDWSDILFGIEEDVDFFALSFVRSSKEVKYLKSFIQQKNSEIQVISKIEKKEALKDIDEILNESDGIMIARGDLGVEIGNDKVPLVQKKLIKLCRKAGKPVITATQMLMSMVDNPTPSRAEASDVANAVFDGSDALMLSNETATGNYPFEAVNTMHTIIRGAEELDPSEREKRRVFDQLFGQKKLIESEAIEASAVVLASSLGAKCLACLTRSGNSARLLSKNRPAMPIFAFVENVKVRAQLCLSWGVFVIPWKEIQLQDYSIFEDLAIELKRLGLIKENDHTIITAGIPTTLKKGATNTVVVKKCPVT